MKRRNFLKQSAIISATTIAGTNTLFSKTQLITPDIQKIKPKRLKEGDTVGLIVPGGYISEDGLKESIENLEKLGLKPYYTDNILARSGYLGGSDKQRSDDFNHMFENDKVDGIICARGGYGCNRILPMLDYDVIRKNPKVLVGYSDITALHNAIYA